MINIRPVYQKYFIRTIFCIIFLLLPAACKMMEFEEDIVEIEGNNIYVSNVGFSGYRLNPPAGYDLITDQELEKFKDSKQWIESFRNGYRNSEGIDYHFHDDFIFQKDGQILFFIPFQFFQVRQFRYTPSDILERFLINWGHKAVFAQVIQYDLKWRAESDENGHSTLILESKTPTNGWVLEKHIMNGDLKELFIFAGFAKSDETEILSKNLTMLRESLEVIR
ncbi:MAG: hypothetical protein AAGH40_05560 [Verrucomicrobiota bacterium]